MLLMTGITICMDWFDTGFHLDEYDTCHYCLCGVFFRGIDVVRNRIKMFAHQKVTLPKGRHKIVILDEADR